MIPIFAGADVRSYLAAEKAGRLQLPRQCPACGGRLWGQGSYERGADETGPDGYHRIPAHRCRCRQCRRTVSFLPSFLRPYQSLVSSARQRLCRRAPAGMSWRELAASVGRSVATVRGLIRKASGEASQVLARLQEWRGEVAGGLPAGPPVLHPPEDDPLGACLDFARTLRQGVKQAHPGPLAAGLLDIVNLLLQGDPAWL
mgnify:CR=1 FL=1